jgi:hypothetical protein
LWSATFVRLGFVFWHSFDGVIAIVKQGSFALGAVAVATLGVHFAYRRFRGRSDRTGADERQRRTTVPRLKVPSEEPGC